MPVTTSAESATSATASAAMDLNAVAFAVEGAAYSSESETHVAYHPQSLYLIGADGVIATILTPDNPQYHTIRAELARLNRLTSLADGQYLLTGIDGNVVVTVSGNTVLEDYNINPNPDDSVDVRNNDYTMYAIILVIVAIICIALAVYIMRTRGSRV